MKTAKLNYSANKINELLSKIEKIDILENTQNFLDVVKTYEELIAYPIEGLKPNDKILVLNDSRYEENDTIYETVFENDVFVEWKLYAILDDKSKDFLKKVNRANTLYGVDGNGNQQNFTFSFEPAGFSIPNRDGVGQLKVINIPTESFHATSKYYVDSLHLLEKGLSEGSLHSKNGYEIEAYNSDGSYAGIKIMPATIAEGLDSIAIGGVRPDRWDEYLSGEKKLTTVLGDFSYAFGVGNYIYDNYSFAGGKDNTLYQGGQTSFGGGNRVGFTEEEFNSFYTTTNSNGEKINTDGFTYKQSWGFNLVGGTLNIVRGLENIVVGLENNVYSYESVISGDKNQVGANQNMTYHLIVSGHHNTVKNSNTLQVGENNVTDALNSINGGSGNVNYGNNNILVGKNSKVNAGGNTCANILGEGLIANAPYQTVLGKFNATNSDALFQIGNGTSDSSRSTIFEVKKDGKAKLLDDNIATEHYVNPHTHTVTNYNDLPKVYDNATEGAVYLVLNENMYYACAKNQSSKTVSYLPYNYTVQSSTPFRNVGNNIIRNWKYLYAQYENKGYVEAVAFTSTTQAWSIPQREGNGQVTVGTPTNDNHAATKKYVDAKIPSLPSDAATSTYVLKAVNGNIMWVKE